MRYIETDELYSKAETWGHSEELWTNRQLRRDFEQCFYNKCWYTETCLDGSDKPIDHFRPKARIASFEEFEYNRPISESGYTWLKNDYKNYRCCCTYANRQTHGGGKGCFFPLLSDVYLTVSNTELEEPALLDPLNREDVKLIYFDKGTVLPSNEETVTIKRVAATKQIYNLTHYDFETRRIKIWEEVERTIRRYESSSISEEVCLEDLTKLISKEAMHSACAISAVKSLASSDIIVQLDLEL